MGKPWSMLMAMLVILTLVINSFEVKFANAKMSESACKEERRIGVNACKPVLYGKVPSPKCCERIRLTHIECVCSVITPKLAALVDIKAAVRIVEGCGRRVPRNYKCGIGVWYPHWNSANSDLRRIGPHLGGSAPYQGFFHIQGSDPRPLVKKGTASSAAPHSLMAWAFEVIPYLRQQVNYQEEVSCPRILRWLSAKTDKNAKFLDLFNPPKEAIFLQILPYLANVLLANVKTARQNTME
ncbi:putative cdc6 [Capsicum annuum]|nr:putative cdc6 [Capsicum annuum]